MMLLFILQPFPGVNSSSPGAVWNKQPYQIEYQYHHADGTMHQFVERGKICSVDQDTWLDVTIVDVSSVDRIHQSLVQENNLIKKAFDVVPDPLALIGPDHRLLQVNTAMAELLGIPADQCVGKLCYTCMHGTETIPENCPHVRSLADRRIHSDEIGAAHMHKIFQVTTAPILDDLGSLLGCIHHAHDITSIKQEEQHLTRACLKSKRNFRS